MGPLKYDGIFVRGCEWSLATFNVRGQSCLKAHGANSEFTAEMVCRSITLRLTGEIHGETLFK